MGEIVRMTQCTTGGPVFVDVQDDKILRIYPIDLDETDGKSWSIEARGKTFKPPRKTTMTSFTAGFKGTVYSDRRIKYPMKRVDFDPNGERNEEKRGESGYERISWDEALDIVCSEIVRMKREHGPGAIACTPGSHHLWGNVGYRHSTLFRFINVIGIMYCDHNPDSWEGWHWGAVHMWGQTHRLGIAEQYGLWEDCMQNCEMIVFWSADPDATHGIYGCHEAHVRRQWLKELGIKMVFIDPYFNHSAGVFADKWFSPQLGTDAALAAAIAYVWIDEDTYDKDYVERNSQDFDVWAAYITGESDGVPKTPEWAAEETKIPAHDIRALAREWAKHKTMLAPGSVGGMGGACRSPIGIDWSRMMIALMTMQGFGKPGINWFSTTLGVPLDYEFFFPGYGEGGISGDTSNTGTDIRFYNRMFNGGSTRGMPTTINVPPGAHIPRLKIPECFMNDEYGPWLGKGFIGHSIEQQFHEYKYPATGFSPARMYYKYGGSFIGTMGGETNRYAKSYRTKNLEFVVNQSIWFEGEAQFADILLPACTNFERWDIGEPSNCSGYGWDTFGGWNHRCIMLQKKCIEPLWESKSDYEIFGMICDRLGVGGPYHEGKTDLDWVKQYFHATDLANVMTWEEFMDKGYYVVPATDKKEPRAFGWFAEGRPRDTRDLGPHPSHTVGMKGLATQSGKVEFVSNSLKRFEKTHDDDPDRPAMPIYQHSWEGHHTERFKDYPLAVVSPHPKHTFHTMADGKDGFVNDIKDHRIVVDGYYYWIMRMSTKDAEDRGIKDGDLVKAFNERGSVIFAAQITERLPAGTCHCYESCAEYDPLGVPGESTDRGGCINILTPARLISKYSMGMAPAHALIQIEKWNGKE